IGGLHPALIEAMAAARPILYLDTPANRETAADCGLPFSSAPNSLSSEMSRVIRTEPLRADLGLRASERARVLYGWDRVASDYEDLCAEVLDQGRTATAGTA